MSERHRTRRLRVTFEPSRLSADQLANAYEQLKPVESREVCRPAREQQNTETMPTRRRGGEQ
jgi:hypothetical protein